MPCIFVCGILHQTALFLCLLVLQLSCLDWHFIKPILQTVSRFPPLALTPFEFTHVSATLATSLGIRGRQKLELNPKNIVGQSLTVIIIEFLIIGLDS